MSAAPLPPIDDDAAPDDHGRRVDLFGVSVDAITMDQTVQRCREFANGTTPRQHVVLNAAKVVAMDRNIALRDAVRACAIVNADGKSVVWASRLFGCPVPERVTGIDLFERLVAQAAADRKSIYLLGARQEVVETVRGVLETRYPSLRVAGIANGYWTDDAPVVAAVRAVRPDYLFLAIPSPRKEMWLREHIDVLGVPFVMGVGGSFDVVAGYTSRAPRWMQRAGLEWFYRFAQEPRRMWKRYLVGNVAFMRLTWSERRRRRRQAASS